MSLALIQETAKEVRRLAVAGSPLAVGDFRLKKLIPPLEQAGAKVPVFAQVAKALSDLANGNENDSAANLLSLSTLVNAILYTQGQTTADGECRDLEMFAAVSASTRTTARVLKPLVEALTNAGAGRFEVVKAGCERGAFNDLRLIHPAIQALDDNYAEIADLVAEKILPNYGPGIIPRLKEKFDLKGKKADGRRLQAMHRLDPTGTIALCKTALEEGSAEVKVAAIACLGKHEDCVPVLLPEANSKNKSVRAAALEALAGHDRPEITKLFIELVKGKNLDMLAAPFRAIRNTEVMNALLSEGNRVFELMVKGEADHIQRYSEILDCLQQRQAESEEFLLACFNQCDKLAKLKAPKNSTLVGADLIARLAELLSGGSPRALETILARQELIPPTSFDCVVNSALRAWPPEKVYQEFAPLLDQKKGASQQKSEAIQTAIFLTRPVVWPGFPDLDGGERGDGDLKSWDPRWLDAAIKADLHSLVCLLARPSHKGVIAYLLKPVDLKEPDEAGQTVAALSVCQYPKVTDVFLDLVAMSTKSTRSAIYQVHFLFQSAKYLPPAELPRLEAFAAKLDEKLVDQFLEALEPLRAAKQTT